MPAALAELERGRNLLRQSGARRDLTRAYMLLARAHQSAGDESQALELLRQALTIGIETQTFHHLVIEGQYIFDLLEQLLRHSPGDRRPAQVMDLIRGLPAAANQVTGQPAALTMSARATLRFYGLGRGRAEKDGQTVVWNSAKARHMVFHLLTFPPRSRDQLFAIFWPDTERDVAAFHTTKYQAHKVLGRNLIVHKDGTYTISWDPDCWFDVAVFESLLSDNQNGDRQARLEQAVALYQGDFLAGYDAAWCFSTREHLRIRYRDALLELGELYEQRGQLANAVKVLGQAVVIDDLHEPAIRALMHLYVHDDRPHIALDVFRQLERRLDAAHTRPSRETRLLRQSIQTDLFAIP